MPDSPIEAVFTNEQLSGVQKRTASQPNSSLLLNTGKGNFELRALALGSSISTYFWNYYNRL